MSIQIDENCGLDKLTIDDAADLFSLIEKDRENMGAYLPWVSDIVDVESTESFISSRIDPTIHGADWYKVHCDQQIIGIFGVKSVNKDTLAAEIGYCLATGFQGRGLVARSIEQLAIVLKQTTAVRTLEMRCFSNNKASIAVATRAGGKLTETVKDYCVLHGRTNDLQTYSVKL